MDFHRLRLSTQISNIGRKDSLPLWRGPLLVLRGPQRRYVHGGPFPLRKKSRDVVSSTIPV